MTIGFRGKTATGLILTIILAGRAMGGPTSRPDRESALPLSAEDQRAENLLDRHLPSVRLPVASLSDSIDFIRDITGANIYVDWKAVELAGVTKDARVTIQADDIPLRGVFTKLLEATGSDSLEIQVIKGVIVVSTKLNFADRKNHAGPYLADLSDIQSATFLERRLARVDLSGVPLSDAIDYLRDITGASILVKWQTMAAAGIDRNTRVTLALRDASLSSVLYFVLEQAGDGKLGYFIEPGERVQYDKALKKPVQKQSALITISTIDDLEAAKANSTTQPN